MEKYKFIYVVVLYKTVEYLSDLKESIIRQNEPYRIILVNNYADEKSLNDARKIALESDDIDLVEMPNNGYGAGNNAGIDYAVQNYSFDYLVVCNSDTVIEKLDVNLLDEPIEPVIYAPEIICSTGKRQNPNWACYRPLIEKMQYVACKYDNQFLDLMAIALLKSERLFFQHLFKGVKRKKIYSAHGAFLIISREAVEKMYPLYDEKMFLFYEEVFLAKKAKKLGVSTFYVPQIRVFHKEDGSMRLANVNQKKQAQKSVVYYYENKR